MRSDDGRVVPTFVRQALENRPITVTGDGAQTRSLCYVDDTIAGLLEVAAGDWAEPINIGSPHETSVLALAELIRTLAGSGSPIVHLAAAPDDPRQRCPDISAAESKLGWRPGTSAWEGLRRTISWRSRADQLPVEQSAMLP